MCLSVSVIELFNFLLLVPIYSSYQGKASEVVKLTDSLKSAQAEVARLQALLGKTAAVKP